MRPHSSLEGVGRRGILPGIHVARSLFYFFCFVRLDFGQNKARSDTRHAKRRALQDDKLTFGACKPGVCGMLLLRSPHADTYLTPHNVPSRGGNVGGPKPVVDPILVAGSAQPP